MKLSIIVPIYNVANYLTKCICSLLEQDLSTADYEIILVDDGSTDACGEIADNFADKYDNIHVIHQKNAGLSAARNTGAKAASGTYIQFVDSDDYLEPNVLGILISKMENEELDVLRFNYQNVNEQYQVFNPYKNARSLEGYRDEVCDGLAFLTERLGYACYVWQFVLKKDLMEDCMFRPGIYLEDVEWTPRMLLKAGRVTSVDTIVYDYQIRSGSITQSVDVEKKRKLLDDKMLSIDFLKRQSEMVSDKRWFESMIANSCIYVLGFVAACFYSERQSYIKDLKKRNLFPLSTRCASKKTLRKIQLMNFSPVLYCWLCRVKNKK